MGDTKKAQEDYIRLTNEAARAQASLNTAIQDSVTKQRALALLQAEATGDKGTLEREKAKQDYEIAVEANRKTYLESQKNIFDQMRYRDTLKSLTEIYKNKQNEIEKGILNDLKKNNKQIQDEHKKHVEEIQKMNSEMRARGGTDEGIYLIQRKKATGVSFGAQSNDELRQGIIKNLEAAKLNVPQTVTFTFKAEGLDDIQKAGQRMVVLNDGMKKMGETLKGMIVPALQNFGNLLGKALGGDNVDAGAALKAMLADMCNAMAMTMYAMAAGYYAVQAYGHAAAATAAGVGLNIAAGVLGAGASGGGVSSGGGGASAAPNIGTFGNGGMNSNFGVLQVGGEIRGNNLLVSVNRSGYERGRVR
jgi:enamine deaminase RidA (YjgF/YER057c/UK114 family)